MKTDFHPQHYYPHADIVRSADWSLLVPALRQAVEPSGIIEWGPELRKPLETEGIFRYIGHQALLRQEVNPGEFKRQVKSALSQGEAEKLSDDQELSRIFEAAKEKGLPILIIKGEVLARTVYPLASCRPTGDYDMLIRPEDLPAFQGMFESLGYSSNRFAGTHIFAEQSWHCVPSKRGRPYLVDLHWDITNRRFFRNRIPFADLWESSVEVSLDDINGKVPSLSHSLLLACVHLAAAPVNEPMLLRWLLDIHLLLNAVNESEFEQLARQSKQWRLADVLALYCAITQGVLGPSRHQETIREMYLRISKTRRWVYSKTCNNRLFDLAEYGWRLKSRSGRMAFYQQARSFNKDRAAYRKRR